MKAKKFGMYFMLVAMLASAAMIVVCVSMAVMHIIGECKAVACDALCVVMFIAFLAVNIFGREYNDIKDEIEMEGWV